QSGSSQGGFVRTRPAPLASPEGASPQEGATTTWHGRVGSGPHPALADAGIQPVRTAGHLAGEGPAGVVLQGGQGPSLDPGSDTRHNGQASRRLVLLHAVGLGRAGYPVGLCRSLGSGGDLRERQTISRLGRSGQSAAQGGAADGSDGSGVA